jgi:hypothetical protein
LQSEIRNGVLGKFCPKHIVPFKNHSPTTVASRQNPRKRLGLRIHDKTQPLWFYFAVIQLILFVQAFWAIFA